jgi:DNA-binding response OmpR family regulator
MSTLVLAVVAEPQLRGLITRSLQESGLQVLEAASAAEAVELARRLQPELGIIALPRIDEQQLSLLPELRRAGMASLLVLASGGGEADVVAALEGGADDCLFLPCSMPELIARTTSLLRRGRVRNEPSMADIQIGVLQVSFAPRQVTVHGRDVELTPREFEILAVLAERAGRVVSRQELVQRVWGSDQPIKRQTLDVYLFSIRSKIEDRPEQPSRLVTVRGVGYRLMDQENSR